MFGCFGPDIVWAGAGMRNAQEQAQSSLQIGSVQDLENGEAQKHLDEFWGALRLFSIALFYKGFPESPRPLHSGCIAGFLLLRRISKGEALQRKLVCRPQFSSDD